MVPPRLPLILREIQSDAACFPEMRTRSSPFEYYGSIGPPGLDARFRRKIRMSGPPCPLVSSRLQHGTVGPQTPPDPPEKIASVYPNGAVGTHGLPGQF